MYRQLTTRTRKKKPASEAGSLSDTKPDSEFATARRRAYTEQAQPQQRQSAGLGNVVEVDRSGSVVDRNCPRHWVEIQTLGGVVERIECHRIERHRCGEKGRAIVALTCRSLGSQGTGRRHTTDGCRAGAATDAEQLIGVQESTTLVVETRRAGDQRADAQQDVVVAHIDNGRLGAFRGVGLDEGVVKARISPELEVQCLQRIR